jgi:hypothetical protein
MKTSDAESNGVRQAERVAKPRSVCSRRLHFENNGRAFERRAAASCAALFREDSTDPRDGANSHPKSTTLTAAWRCRR